MIIVERKIISVILVSLLFLTSFFCIRYLVHPRIRLGEHTIIVNYRAKINPKKIYKIKLWDYKWPGIEGEGWYQQFIEKVVKNFEKENPNIQVSLSLLDFREGPNIFSKALASGAAPDVYCSAYDIPEFDYQWQIPAAIFLKPEELNVYYPELRKLVTLNNYQLTLPRWSVPGIWIGNRALMEKSGLSVEQIQRYGWSWRDLTKIKERTEPICIGNFSANGLLSQLLTIDARDEPDNNINRVLDIINFINGPLPQKSDIEAVMFQKFLSGKVMFLGGVRPIIYDFILQKANESKAGLEPVILPVPSEKPNQIILPVENSVIGIYRHKKTGSDDQLAAATRLAYFISTYPNTAPWQRLKVVPAVPAIALRWAGNLNSTDYPGQLVKWFNEASIVNLKVPPGYQEEVYPGLKNFLSGKMNHQELEGIIKKNYDKVYMSE